MIPQLHVIEWPGPGRLATMRRPPGGAELAPAMAALARAGVDVLVCALFEDEAELLDLADEPAAARAAGLELFSLPIVDGRIPTPDSMPAVERLVEQLVSRLRAGRFVVTHCHAGIGRCSMLAGAALVRLGVSPAEAWERIRAARGLPVPDNPRQEAWLYEFAAR